MFDLNNMHILLTILICIAVIYLIYKTRCTNCSTSEKYERMPDLSQEINELENANQAIEDEIFMINTSQKPNQLENVF